MQLTAMDALLLGLVVVLTRAENEVVVVVGVENFRLVVELLNFNLAPQLDIFNSPEANYSHKCF